MEITNKEAREFKMLSRHKHLGLENKKPVINPFYNASLKRMVDNYDEAKKCCKRLAKEHGDEIEE